MPEVKKIKIELIRLKFDDSVLYKYKPFKYCCETITKNETIEFTTESSTGDYDVCDDDNFTLPHFSSWFVETEKDGEDEWENDYYYPIEFCPHCGEKIEIVVVGEEDRTEEYLELKKQRDDLWKKCQRTDSKKKENELRRRVKELDSKIDWFYELCEYEEVKH
ncbi:hypothetical protein HMPREF9467_00851 [ [[Clostridium] clostridioforme 2_1_49FAA]|nr:hypothetical protein [Enterocloster clostridioformis]EHG33240.1 hypothetical protein HMPREF9467_00851 [ [[Clostridium] clostridioforme 2_1_49FAA]